MNKNFDKIGGQSVFSKFRVIVIKNGKTNFSKLSFFSYLL